MSDTRPRIELVRPQGIDGLRGRPPIGVAVTAGRKAPGGKGIIEKDRFHIVYRRQNPDGVKELHPEFRAFNELRKDEQGRVLPGELEKRRVIRGNLVHARREQCFNWGLKAQILDRQHPNKAPACMGNGVSAIRWMGPGPDDYQEIVCPGRQCEYQQVRRVGKYEVVSCKPWMQLIFQLRWRDGSKMPTPLAIFTSKGWNTTANFYGHDEDGTPGGFFGQIEVAAAELGLKNFSLFGYPFMLTMREQTKPSERSRFAVIDVTPEMSPVEFFAAQAKLRAQIGGFPEPLSLLEERTIESEAEDERSISIPGVYDAEMD